MKAIKHKIACVGLMGMLMLGGRFLSPLPVMATDESPRTTKTDANDLGSRLIGTWTLGASTNPGSPSGIGTRLKLFTGNHWCVIQPDPKTGEIIFQHGGRYVLEGNKIRTTLDFAGESTKSMIGNTASFTVQVDGDTYKQLDPNGVYNETWKRVK